MNRSRTAADKIVALIVALSLSAALRSAQAASDSEASQREAAKHFQQGVTFYGEADYRSALVEFRRAATIAPSSAALYNIAETEYQLRDYAGALKTFERYLSAVGPNDAHRAEVEGDIKLLRARVGRLNIATNPAGADITVDDEHVGKTPFAQPLIVNVGHLKVAAAAEGHLSMTQYVDVAADDNVTVSLELARPTLPQEAALLGLSAPASPGIVESRDRSSLRRVAWIGAGVAAAGAITFAVLAHNASSDLQDARRTYLMNSEHLDDLASRTTRYAVLTDIFAVTAIAASAWAFFAFTETPRGGTSAGLRVSPTSIALQAIF